MAALFSSSVFTTHWTFMQFIKIILCVNINLPFLQTWLSIAFSGNKVAVYIYTLNLFIFFLFFCFFTRWLAVSQLSGHLEEVNSTTYVTEQKSV